MKFVAWVIVAILVVAAVVQHSIYWPQLPNQVASHFGANGEPDGWLSRTVYTLLMAGIQIGLPLFLAGLGRLTGWIPVSMINIPNREYWLGKSQRRQTLDYLGSMLAWIAVLSGLFFMLISLLVFVANVNGLSLNDSAFFGAMMMYVVTVFGIVGYLFWRFRLPVSNSKPK